MELRMSDSISNLAMAMVKVQGALPTIHKDKKADIQTLKGGKMTYTYADLAVVWGKVRQVLSEQGLALLQPFSSQDGKALLQTVLLHTSGEFIAGELQITLDASDPRRVGSTITYYRRYCLAAMVGAVTSDEDTDAADVADRSQRPTGVTVRRPGAPQARTGRQESREPAQPPRQSEPSSRQAAPPRQTERAPQSPAAESQPPAPASSSSPAAPSVDELGKAVLALKTAHGNAYPGWWEDRYARALAGLDLAADKPLLSKPNLTLLVTKRPEAAAQLLAEIQTSIRGLD